jgi:hypothetical protein
VPNKFWHFFCALNLNQSLPNQYIMKKILYSLFIAFSPFCFSQNQANFSTEQKIKNVFNDYFTLNREAIHLHLVKSTFFNEETIWFKGYVINRNNSNPNISTNIYVALLDEKGNKISSQLVLANDGIFTGSISLNNNMASGRYYLQSYTNWMNNFSENESTITPIDIINPDEGYKNYDNINFETLEVDINPEGGKLIKGISNTIGIQVSDCQNNTLKNLEGKIIDDKNEIIKSFKLNQFGLAKIELPPITSNLKVNIITPKGEISKELPQPESKGYGLEVNSFTSEDKLIIKIKSNLETIKNDQNIFLVVNQDNKSVIEKIDFEANNEKTIYINNKNIFNGLVTIRIIDEDLNQLAERLAYIRTNQTSEDHKISKNSIKLNNLNQGNVSVSILPQTTKSIDLKIPIAAGLKVNPYLAYPLKNANYYFINTDRQKEYELDLALLNQKQTKYSWDYIKLNPPKQNYSFDIGLTLKGSITTEISRNKNYKIKLFSLGNLLSETSDINENKEFIFENLIIKDSTQIELLLLEMPDLEIKNSKMVANIIDINKAFNKSTQFSNKENCSPITEFVKLDTPKLQKNTISLKEVSLTNKFQKQALDIVNVKKNFMLRGHKVDIKHRSTTLLTFLRKNGFDVSPQYAAKLIIRSRNYDKMPKSSDLRSKLNSASTPISSVRSDTRSIRGDGAEVWLNDILLVDLDELKFINMDDIDEIYLNPNINPVGMNNNQGIIRIYLKEKVSKPLRKDTQIITIKDGFSIYKPYKQLSYISKLDDAFFSFGIYNWEPNYHTNNKGEIDIDISKITNANVLIEGIVDNEIYQRNLTIE